MNINIIFLLGVMTVTASENTMITMMNSGDTMKLSCPNNKMHMCKWWHHNAAMPDHYGNIEIGSKGNMKITEATVHNSGSYTLDMGTTTETHHIIVKPAGHMPMVIEGNHILNKTFKNMHMYNQLVQHVVFENVHFTNMHFHMMHFKNVTFRNCYFEWDQDLPMHAEFHHCHFINTVFHKPHFRHCSFFNCNFVGGHKMENMDSAPTFYDYHIHDTIFSHVDWYNTHWHHGIMYNMTFNHNIFTHHMTDHMLFHNHHYDVIPCHEFKHDVMTLEHWMMKDNNCMALVHRPNAIFHHDCEDEHPLMKMVCGEHHHSMKFYETCFEECNFENCNMDSIEWRNTHFYKTRFEHINMTGNHFSMCHHTVCHWENIRVCNWMKFTANNFYKHYHHMITGNDISYHSCHFADHTFSCQECKEVHYMHCHMQMFMMTPKTHIIDMHMMDVNSHGFHMQGKIDNMNYCHVYMDDITMTECIIGHTKNTCEDHMEQVMMYFCKKHPHHPDCAHMKMLGCLHCYHDDDDDGGFPHNRHQHHYWKKTAFGQIHDDDVYYIRYHTPNTHHTERQHCLEYDAVVYINPPHYVVKMILAKEHCHYDADRHREVSMYIYILMSYIFATCTKIITLMIIYNIRPEQPAREERDEDEGDLPFPIPAVEPD